MDSSCSYRWNAAHRARSDWSVDKPRRQPSAALGSQIKEGGKRIKKRVAKLEKSGALKARFEQESGVWGRRWADPTRHFETGYWPWLNDVHHLVPCSVLRNLIDHVAEQAEAETSIVREEIERSLFSAMYNINDEINVVILPLLRADAENVQLPRHLDVSERDVCDHPCYSAEVETHLRAKFDGIYSSLVKAVEDRKHLLDQKAKDAKDALEGVSRALRKKIESLGAAESFVKKLPSLDCVAPTLFK
ncbi:hypothetical protein ACNOYE_00530 [Nannocystaceae bacterium ST9]